jgi:hypothetical protein
VVGPGELGGQGVGQFDAPLSGGEVVVVELPPPVELVLEPGPGGRGGHDEPVLVPLPAADGELPALQVDVLDPQPAALHQP